jgi:hypothetical protein
MVLIENNKTNLMAKTTRADIDSTLGRFQRFLEDKTAKQIANLLSEYIMESNHNGWDGWENRDLKGVALLFQDMIIYHAHSESDFTGHAPYGGYKPAYKEEE